MCVTDGVGAVLMDSPHPHPPTQAGRLERQWKEKEGELAQLKLDWKSETDRLRDELISLQASYEQKIKAYKDLFDLKIKLDQELETYRQLLEAEESR